MSGMATTVRVTLQQFLALPESKPYLELMDGEVHEKPMPNNSHGELVAELIYLLKVYQRRNGTFRIVTEVRHADVEHQWVFLPDVSVTLSARVADVPGTSAGGPVLVMPDIAIEVLSPEDRPGMVARRVEYYRRAGVALVWIVDPEAESITVWNGGALPDAGPRRGFGAARARLPVLERALERREVIPETGIRLRDAAGIVQGDACQTG